MQLPSELRNIIYGYALEDPSGIHFVATFKHRRRTVERVSAEAQSQVVNHSRYHTMNRINDEAQADCDEPVALVPSLLAVSKQIYQEGHDILYNNEFIFADTFALYSFMINLGPTGAKHLTHLRLMRWGTGRVTSSYNHSCFAVLVWAINLKTLRLDKPSDYARDAKNAANKFYRDAFPWLEAVGIAKGKVDAGVDVLKIDAEAFNYAYWRQNNQLALSGEKKREQYFEQLSGLLGAQQKRIMATPVKKKKATKDADED
jgi:hypothetical protein